ncbi:hypothetical protein JVT61DRAFT_13641 [Boletus reticuloceps]|uniref:Uncharacterized protein n=1 Tax=Boletus reticuloceps TaxID=495285 RepID=A0A8I2YD55_9AGAM|nr:hypothetical protein JVT61DRAFT_13641 [Boletus reticuloceps]
MNDHVHALSRCKDPAIGPVDVGAALGSSILPGLEHTAGGMGSEVHPFNGNEGVQGALKSKYHDSDLPHSLGRSLNSSAAMSIMNSIDNQQRPVPDQDAPDFKTEYHPHSKCPTLFQMSDKFCVCKYTRPPLNPAPWHPFQCQGDFEFAKIALEASLNKGQVDTLLNLISCMAKREAQVTFENDAQLRKVCNSAVEELTPVSKHNNSIYAVYNCLIRCTAVCPTYGYCAV